ncbi:hypothetical protein A2480_03645 [Candidatus Uhrbacteria bacterium RIFOXYC2_FULL_47_19]|uniref:Uncharacterized protein n=1 Tax=Candidatus Uhrbacteria bacterium RIFOXYC2_FULL_47_19 TaxID=1802424 RepID=A0A1F7WBF6_9BACT|nr:MAG: hypothetical protein A2480_03645 [Candidatus Uhrbacteria bacterium RIFOXYC2_FULL_47_19]HCC21948.1 hypothetical protein [Candidatus Uhrbacteria bacterium]
MIENKTLTPHQKLGLGVIVVIGLTTLVFGVFQMRKSIFDPLARNGDLNLKTPEQIEEERVTALKAADTDQDGLNDYDELYLFRTSPFLTDSDSDGLSDGVEVAQSSDPNCPLDKNCRQVSSAVPVGEVPQTGDVNSLPPEVSPDEATILQAMERVFGDLNSLTPEKMNERLQLLTPEELRTFMLEIGVPQTMLDQADDATLRQLLADTMGEMPAPDTTEVDAEPTE